MTSKKLLIEVELVPVVVSIIAEPGDKLMMLNGLCIGVDTSREVAPIERRALPPPTPVGKPLRRSKAYHHNGRARNPDSYTSQAREIILKKMVDGKPHSRREMYSAISDRRIKGCAYPAITMMIRDKEIIEGNPGVFTIAVAKSSAPKSPTYQDNRLMLYRDMKGIGIELSRQDVNKLISAGEFPRSTKIGTTEKWRRSEVEAWLLNRQAA